MREGFDVARCTVSRLMRDMGLQGDSCRGSCGFIRFSIPRDLGLDARPGTIFRLAVGGLRFRPRRNHSRWSRIWAALK